MPELNESSFEHAWYRGNRLVKEAVQRLRAVPDFADAEQFPDDLLEEAYKQSSAEHKKWEADQRNYMSGLARVLGFLQTC